MTIPARVLIIGASVAGTETATQLARQAPGVIVTLVDGSAEQPYDRPPLSKGMIVDPVAARRPLLHAGAELELVLGDPVVDLDPVLRTARLQSGTVLHWDYLVIATGALPRLPAWASAVGAHTLRTADDAARLAAQAARGGAAVVVGGGLIGTEVASTLVGLGLTVDLVHSGSLLSEAALGTAVARELTALHLNNGVRVHLESSVVSASTDARGTWLQLSSGDELRADLVLAAVGAVPDSAVIGQTAGEPIPCDAYGRVIGLENVLAVGDVSAWADALGDSGSAHQHWTNAVEQARVAASTIAGLPTEPHQPSHYVWSDQFGVRIERTGHIVGEPLRVVEASGAAQYLYTDGAGVLVGAASIGAGRSFAATRKAVRAGASLTDSGR